MAEGLPLLEAAVAEETHTVMRGASSRLRRLGVGYLTAGRLAEALDCAQRALSVAREQGAGRHAAKALLFLGEVLEELDTPSLADAHRCYDEALADAERRGFRPTAARAHLRLGLLARRTGHAEEAERHLKTADGMLRAMGMTPWVDAAEAAGRDLIHGRAGTA